MQMIQQQEIIYIYINSIKRERVEENASFNEKDIKPVTKTSS